MRLAERARALRTMFDAGRVGRDEEHRRALVRARRRGSVTTMTMRKAGDARRCDEKYFSPLITHSSPSFTARHRELAGSAPRCGSVIE